MKNICTKHDTTYTSTEDKDTNVYPQHNEIDHQELCNDFKSFFISCSDLGVCTNDLQPFKNFVNCSQNTDYFTQADLTSKFISCNTLYMEDWNLYLIYQECIEQAP